MLAGLGAAAIWAGIATGDRDLPAPPKPERGPHLFLSGKYGEVWRVDAGGGVVHADVRELKPGDPPHHLLARGNELVGYGRKTYLLDPALREEPEELAHGSLFFLPSAHHDRVWIATEDDDPDTPGLIATVREVGTDGEVTVEDARPPEGAWPEAAVEAGIVLAPGGRRIVWDPETGEVVFTFPTPRGDLGPTHGNLVVWCEQGCPELHVTDVVSGKDTTIAAPEGFRGFRGWDGSFSPDGRTIAVPVGRGDGSGRVHLALVDVEAASAAVVPGTETDDVFNFVAWSASGRHVFFTGAEGFDDRRIFVYEVGAQAARRLDAPDVGEFYDATAI